MKNRVRAAGALALLAALMIPIRPDALPAAPRAPAPAALEAPVPRPSPEPPATEPRRKVLILGMDGLRSDALLSARTPNLDRLMAEGSHTTAAFADRITRSGPGWTSILTGAWSPKHGVVDNELLTYRRGEFPHLFRRIKEADPSLVTASLVNWEPIHGRLVSHADLSTAYGDDDSVAHAAARLLERGDPDVLFLHFDAPDYAGHRYGFSRYSPPYLSAIRRTDARVGRVLEALARRPARASEEWLIVAVTDHGGTLRHHGEDIPACRRVPLIVAGDAAVPGGALEGAGLADVMPTALAHLGIGVDPAWGLDGKAVGLRAGAERVARGQRDGSEEGNGSPGTGEPEGRGLGGSAGDGFAGQPPDLREQGVR